MQHGSIQIHFVRNQLVVLLQKITITKYSLHFGQIFIIFCTKNFPQMKVSFSENIKKSCQHLPKSGQSCPNCWDRAQPCPSHFMLEKAKINKYQVWKLVKEYLQREYIVKMEITCTLTMAHDWNSQLSSEHIQTSHCKEN